MHLLLSGFKLIVLRKHKRKLRVKALASQTKTIELNGKLYDARTGQIISTVSESSQPIDKINVSETNKTPAKQPITASSNPKVVDGFIKPKAHTSSKVSEPKLSHSSHSNINHTKRHLSKSQTLMRQSLKKPQIQVKKVKPVVKKPEFVAKTSGPSVARINRAESTTKNPLVSKFGHVGVSGLKKSVAHMPVVAPPSHHKISNNHNNNVISDELAKFEEVIKNANSHLEKLEKDAINHVPFLKRVGFKNRFANLATMTAAVLILGGFFTYQNMTYVSLRMASNKAGVAAKMPGYTPAGYGADRNVKSGDGQVAIRYQSNTDDKYFTITQSASNWNSSSLLANYVQKRNCETCYQTWPENGKTIYTYDNSSATWVDGGVWYNIEGNASLTSDQLLRIASSL